MQLFYRGFIDANRWWDKKDLKYNIQTTAQTRYITKLFHIDDPIKTILQKNKAQNFKQKAEKWVTKAKNVPISAIIKLAGNAFSLWTKTKAPLVNGSKLLVARFSIPKTQIYKQLIVLSSKTALEYVVFCLAYNNLQSQRAGRLSPELLAYDSLSWHLEFPCEHYGIPKRHKNQIWLACVCANDVCCWACCLPISLHETFLNLVLTDMATSSLSKTFETYKLDNNN